MERQLQRLNWLTVRKLVPAKTDTVILPVGTVEGHGSSCLGTDNFIPETISGGIAERINALIAPTVNYGITKSLYRYPGGVTIRPEVFGAYIKDVLSSLADTGFRNVILMNGHGGNNTVLKTVAHDFHRNCKANICVIHWWELCGNMTREFFGHVGGHGGTDETAMVQAVDEKLVDKNAFDPELAYYCRPGADVYPIPGSILLYKEGEGLPNFDSEQAVKYRKKVIAEVGGFIEMIIARWRKFAL
ncbi:MAG: creatininase family protein [candidate division Zixibacteria bacterium]|nr:creatininase family protein [candidate division Zixibacteria bacterium]